jgi:uncharacterized membrane protein YphA (DoxX/SURF4 family)
LNSLAGLITYTSADYKPFIPRLVTGLVFLSEGIQKYLFPESLGPGRFEQIGFHDPTFLAYFVATFEITCGILVIIGFVTRIAAVPLFVIILTAIISTKIPMLASKGFWGMVHEARVDFAMTMLLLFLLIYGAGKLSFDFLLSGRRRENFKARKSSYVSSHHR